MINLHKQIDIKDQLIEFLQIQLIKQEKETISATCGTSDLYQIVDKTCDTNDIMEKIDTTRDTSNLVKSVDKDNMIDDSLSSHEK